MKFIILALVLSSCFADYVDLDKTSYFTINPDESKYLSLKSNPTTGYSWEVTPIDSKIFTVTYIGYSSSNSDLIGSGGIQVFKLDCSADAKGESLSITFSYKRSWEKEPISVKLVTVQSIYHKNH